MSTGPMSDRRIKEMVAQSNMIDPFVNENVKEIYGYADGQIKLVPIISYGLSSFGYDIRVADEFQIFSNLHYGVIDPKNFDRLTLTSVKEQSIIIPPNAFALARSVEYLKIPKNVIGICIGKSTYARCGLVANITALEPEWEGHLTIELSNTAPIPIQVYANEGIAQLIFFEAEEDCVRSYADKHGKYQGQTGITYPRV